MKFLKLSSPITNCCGGYSARTAVFIYALVCLRISTFPDPSSLIAPQILRTPLHDSNDEFEHPVLVVCLLFLSFVLSLARLIGSVGGLIGLVFDKPFGLMTLLVSTIIDPALNFIFYVTYLVGWRLQLQYSLTLIALWLGLTVIQIWCSLLTYSLYRIMKADEKILEQQTRLISMHDDDDDDDDEDRIWWCNNMMKSSTFFSLWTRPLFFSNAEDH